MDFVDVVVPKYSPYFWGIQKDGMGDTKESNRLSLVLISILIRLNNANNWFATFKAWSDRAFMPGSKLTF